MSDDDIDDELDELLDEIEEAAPPRFVEQIKGYVRGPDGSDFLVIARQGQGWISKGAIYVFLQDRSSTVWQVVDVQSKGFFNRRVVVSLRSRTGDRRQFSISDLWEAKEDDVIKCLGLAKLHADTSAVGVIMYSDDFQWSSYDRSDLVIGWSKGRR